jgi:hypothetical protein
MSPSRASSSFDGRRIAANDPAHDSRTGVETALCLVLLDAERVHHDRELDGTARAFQ